MAAKKKAASQDNASKTANESDELAVSLIADLNKEFGARVAYNLSEDTAPTLIKQWIGSSSLLLDYAISNRRGGGYPSGRIIEVAGLPSTGKSHLAYEAARNTQRAGGLVVYVDTENATSIDKLGEMGIDVRKRFVYVDMHCTEDIFTLIDSIVRKARPIADKGQPVLVVWDSIAATSPKEELEGAYDKSTMGLNARVLSKGMRKLTGVLGQCGVTLLVINQLRMKFGVMFGDPYVTPGGNGVPYHSTVRVRLTGEGTAIKNKDNQVIGIKVPFNIIKNKIAPPKRSYAIEIHFGKGIVETETLIDVGIDYCEAHEYAKRGEHLYKMTGKGKQWKKFAVMTNDGEVLYEKSFQKESFNELLHNDKIASPLLKEFYDIVLTISFAQHQEDDGLNPPTDEGGEELDVTEIAEANDE